MIAQYDYFNLIMGRQTHPEIAKEWYPTKNGELTAETPY